MISLQSLLVRVSEDMAPGDCDPRKILFQRYHILNVVIFSKQKLYKNVFLNIGQVVPGQWVD